MDQYMGEIEVDGTEWVWRAITMATGRGADPIDDPHAVFLQFESPDDPDQHLYLKRAVDIPEDGVFSEARLRTLAHQAPERVWKTADGDYWRVTHHTGVAVGSNIDRENLPDPILVFEREGEESGLYDLKKGITSLASLSNSDLDHLLHQAMAEV